MTEPTWNALKQQVYKRAHGRCEYCQTSESNTGQTMHVDHIDPQGGDVLNNLCLACWNCNTSKHKAVDALDSLSGQITPLFNPRLQSWSEHFRWIDNGIRIEGLSATGRVTVDRLKMNRASIVVARQRWVAGGFHPPA